MGSLAACSRNLNLSSGILLASIMLIALLFFFGLNEAAFDFDSRGPAEQSVAGMLHLCTAINFGVALLIVIAVMLLPKRTHRTYGASAS
jgi:hypothetical protein